MIRPALLTLALAACATAAPAPDGAVAIRYGGETYPVERMESRPEQWRVRTPNGPVPCRAPTEEDCYWSLRAALLAQEMPDLPG